VKQEGRALIVIAVEALDGQGKSKRIMTSSYLITIAVTVVGTTGTVGTAGVLL
jgi:hypothetical protein